MDPIAQADQNVEGAKHIARYVAAFFNALIAAGVPLEQAAALTSNYQASLFRQPVNAPGGES